MKKRSFVALSDREALMVLGGKTTDEHPWDADVSTDPAENTSDRTVEPDSEHPWDSD